tara:strand:+ start:64 stop:276 length:213 start_codon:yes stop_codon:yes gene_type:complete
MTGQDREWVKLIAKEIVAAACKELATELPKNCPVLKKAKFATIGLITGVTIAGMGSPLLGDILRKLFTGV